MIPYYESDFPSLDILESTMIGSNLGINYQSWCPSESYYTCDSVHLKLISFYFSGFYFWVANLANYYAKFPQKGALYNIVPSLIIYMVIDM